MIMERYILECATVDSLNRPRNPQIVGIFKNLTDVQEHMKKVMNSEPDTRHRWNVNQIIDPVHVWLA